jgi:hypothetical protein
MEEVPESDVSCLNCPDCGTVNHAMNGIESFPKNLALL